MLKEIDKFIDQFQGQTFSNPKDVEIYLRENISALVEKIYKEELEIADIRWKKTEKYRKRYFQLLDEIELTNK